nr:Bacteriophage protein of unknown function DUF646 [uncultured organism]
MPKNTISIDLAGMKELETALLGLDKAVAGRIGRKAVREPALVLRTVLSLTAPYLPGRRDHRGVSYGHLRENLKVVSVRARKPGMILYRVSTGDAFWGNFLELGTAKMPAQPWMRPQVDKMTGEIIATKVKVLSDGIAAQAKKQAKRAAALLPDNGGA